MFLNYRALFIYGPMIHSKDRNRQRTWNLLSSFSDVHVIAVPAYISSEYERVRIFRAFSLFCDPPFKYFSYNVDLIHPLTEVIINRHLLYTQATNLNIERCNVQNGTWTKKILFTLIKSYTVKYLSGVYHKFWNRLGLRLCHLRPLLTSSNSKALGEPGTSA